MNRRRLLWQLYPSYLLITLLSLLAVTIYTARTLESFLLDETKSNLEARARLIEPEITMLLRDGLFERLEQVVRVLGERSGTRITIIRPDGIVLADSEKDPATMDNHGDRPEVVVALQGGAGSSTRFSDTLLQDMMYVAIPLHDGDGELFAIVRTSESLQAITDAIQVLLVSIAIGSLIVAVLAAIVSWVSARRISLPLERMKLRARRIAAGDMSGRLPEEGSEEVAALAAAINLMLIRLDDRIRIIERQRREQQAVFASISDGVLAVDAGGRLLTVNRAAARMFDLRRSQVRGRTIHEVIRNETLRRFILESLRTEQELEDEIMLGELDPRYIQVHGRPLRDENAVSMGAVVVLNDVTRLRRLEKARRDFVANVSHELRTPVTSIIGYVETLAEAKEDPADFERFIGVVRSQSDRLAAIIEDLLSLARIERDAETRGIERYETTVREIVDSAVASVEQIAETRRIRIELDVPGGIRALLNPPLVEQALVNLLSNAIKYSEAGTTVRVNVDRTETHVHIRVADEGVGIEQIHLPRLFERFYRVDKGRSRKEGGTGLGLAIVKHIALAHGGRVGVESTPGKGSVFSIYLPVSETQIRQLSLLETM